MPCLDHNADRAVGLPIIDSYPPLHGWQLHSLAQQVNFTCAVCGRSRESVMLAIDDAQRPICPACYAQHTAELAAGSASPSHHSFSD